MGHFGRLIGKLRGCWREDESDDIVANLNSMLRRKLLALFEQEHGEWVFPSPKRFQMPGQPETHISDVKNAFRRAVSLAGIKPITFHQLRHTFCSRLADAGVPMPVIQDLAGHASIIMTRRYTHPADERKQQAIEALLGSPKG
jgi:integrase